MPKAGAFTLTVEETRSRHFQSAKVGLTIEFVLQEGEDLEPAMVAAHRDMARFVKNTVEAQVARAIDAKRQDV